MRAPRIGRLILPAMVAASLVYTGQAQAFLFIRGGSFAKGERPILEAPVWSGRVVKFYLNPNLRAYQPSNNTADFHDPDITAANFRIAVEKAILAWSAACRADVRVELVGTTTGLDNPDDQLNVITYDNRTPLGGNQFGDDSILAAATSVLFGKNFYDCDIAVNGDANATFAAGTTSPVTGTVDLQSVLTHEIGHCLGLDHPVESGNYSSANAYLAEATLAQSDVVSGGPEGFTRRDINQDDRDGIECIYERGLPPRRGSRCVSYHGTNGNGAILDGFSGGAKADLPVVCGSNGDARTALPNATERGAGCVGSAVGSTDFENPEWRESGIARLAEVFGWCLLFVGWAIARGLFQRRVRSSAE